MNAPSPGLDILLYQPEIAPNTGNVIRLSANTGCRLHLIRPLGFEMDDARLRRAGLDYREWASVSIHADLASCLATVAPRRLLALTTRAERRYEQVSYRHGDAFLFGPETRGLPEMVLDAIPPERRLRIPLRPSNRSLNLSNAVAVVIYEAWRQLGFPGGA